MKNTNPPQKMKAGEPLKKSLGINHFQLRPKLLQQRHHTSFKEGQTSRQPNETHPGLSTQVPPTLQKAFLDYLPSKKNHNLNIERLHFPNH